MMNRSAPFLASARLIHVERTAPLLSSSTKMPIPLANASSLSNEDGSALAARSPFFLAIGAAGCGDGAIGLRAGASAP